VNYKLKIKKVKLKMINQFLVQSWKTELVTLSHQLSNLILFLFQIKWVW